MEGIAIRETLECLIARKDLSEAAAIQLLHSLMREDTTQAMAAALLTALASKGITATELRGFANGMRELARRPDISADLCARAIDIVGTGGDASGSLNISTGTALLVAACGIPVIKHGNRSISSRSGSADVLEQLGLVLPLDEKKSGACLATSGFTFLFAPHYHPAMKAIASVRQALGIRTIFNILGPLINPAAPAFQVIGAYSEAIAALMAQSLVGSSTVTRAFVVHGASGWDEPTPIGPFTLFQVHAGTVKRTERTPADYGLAICSAADLAGGDAVQNAARLRAALSGVDQGAHRDSLLMGASLALECVGRARTPKEGVALAAAAISEGRASIVLQQLAQFSAVL